MYILNVNVSHLTFSCVYLRGTLKFSDVMAAGSDVTKRGIVDMQDSLQFDEPINIQFTSVGVIF